MESQVATEKTAMSRIGAIGTDRGFTLLELLIVICIAGLISATFALSVGGTLGRSRHQALVLEVQVELSRVAEAARQTGLDQAVYIRALPAGTDLICGARTFRIAAPTSVEWIAAAELAGSGGAGGILFFGAGGASGGMLRISDAGATETITVDWLTGRVKLAGSAE
jgi:prepilin-type N-terminal cleavage/methylation domain-containing protein